MRTAGVGLGQLLLALDATLVSLVDAPRGLDLPVGSAALIDSDDVRLGLAAAAGSADVFFLLGVTDDEALRWVDRQGRRPPVAIFVKEPSNALVAKAAAAGKQATVTMRNLAAKLAEEHELSRKQTEAVLGNLVTQITKHLKKGDRIRIGGLGILQVRKRAARMGRNPATGEPIQIKASKKVAFRAAKELKESI